MYQFEKEIGLSHGILRSGSDFGSDKLKNIRERYPDLNMNWLIYGEGEMILETNVANEKAASYGNIDDKLKGILEHLESLQCDVDNIKTLIKIDEELKKG